MTGEKLSKHKTVCTIFRLINTGRNFFTTHDCYKVNADSVPDAVSMTAEG